MPGEPITIIGRQVLTEQDDVRFHLSNGWFIDSDTAVRRRAVREHRDSAWEPGGHPSGCAALRGTASNRSDLLAQLNAMLGRP